jgi:hypothetical protein
MGLTIKAAQGSLAQYATTSRTVRPQGFLAICLGSSTDKEEPVS